MLPLNVLSSNPLHRINVGCSILIGQNMLHFRVTAAVTVAVLLMPYQFCHKSVHGDVQHEQALRSVELFVRVG